MSLTPEEQRVYDFLKVKKITAIQAKKLNACLEITNSKSIVNKLAKKSLLKFKTKPVSLGEGDMVCHIFPIEDEPKEV